MNPPRKTLLALIEQGAIPAEKIESAVHLLKIRPDGKHWRSFIDQLLLWLGTTALAFAVMFFIAYNWSDLGRFAKFGLVEACIVIAVAAHCKLAADSIAGKVALLAASILLGVLLALFGQTYQTGADPWQLFFNWALMMLPWAIVGRFPAIWLIWTGLINTSIVLYFLTFRGFFGFVFASESAMLWLLFLVNTTIFVAWQLLAGMWPWLAQRWAVRLMGLASGVPLTWLVLFTIIENLFKQGAAGLIASAAPGISWLLWMIVMYFMYRKVRPDLFMLAMCCLSAITVTVTFLARYLLHHFDPGAFLFLAMVTIGMGGGAAWWLKHINKEFQQIQQVRQQEAQP